MVARYVVSITEPLQRPLRVRRGVVGEWQAQ